MLIHRLGCRTVIYYGEVQYWFIQRTTWAKVPENGNTLTRHDHPRIGFLEVSMDRNIKTPTSARPMTPSIHVCLTVIFCQ